AGRPAVLKATVKRETRNRRSARALTTVIVALVAVAAGGAAGYFLANRFGKQPTNAGADTPANPAARDKVTALGRLQPEGAVIPVYGPPGDRIAKLYPLAPGTVLKAGDPIADLASRKDRQPEV